MPTYTITHTTTYDYSTSTTLSYNEARLLPRSFQSPTFDQSVLQSSLMLTPASTDAAERLDFFGNHASYFAIRDAHEQMRVSAESRVSITPKTIQIDNDLPWETVRDALQQQNDSARLRARQFTFASPIVQNDALAQLRDYAAVSLTPMRSLYEATTELMGRIYRDFEYVPGTTTVATPLSEVAASMKGVCQDYAHFMIACLRAWGLAARYVSGYIENVVPAGVEKLEGADASHAWVSVFIPTIGWCDFDPTNNKVPFDQHITIAWGRDFTDVTPIRGVIFGSGNHVLSVSVTVRKQSA